MYDNLLVVVQGNIRMPVDLIESAWNNFNLLWSVWEDDNLNLNYPIIKNKKPSNFGVKNVGLQSFGTLQGIEYAKENGFTHVLKWRTDQYPTNAKEFIKLFDFEKLNVLAKDTHPRIQHRTTSGKVGISEYYIDYFMLGKTEDLYNVWSLEDINNVPFAEYETTNRINMLSTPVNYICNNLTEKNDVIWYRRGPNHGLPPGTDLKLHTYNQHEFYYSD
jgi:hypothetical protein